MFDTFDDPLPRLFSASSHQQHHHYFTTTNKQQQLLLAGCSLLAKRRSYVDSHPSCPQASFSTALMAAFSRDVHPGDSHCCVHSLNGVCRGCRRRGRGRVLGHVTRGATGCRRHVRAFQAAHAVIRSSAPGCELSVTTTYPPRRCPPHPIPGTPIPTNQRSDIHIGNATSSRCGATDQV